MNDLKEKIIAQFVVGDLPQPLEKVTGAQTTLQCQCGGLLEEILFKPKLPTLPPNLSRKKRIQKKQIKQWTQKHRLALLGQMMITPLMNSHPSFRCMKCGRTEGFYSTMGRNLFQVEPIHFKEDPEPSVP